MDPRLITEVSSAVARAASRIRRGAPGYNRLGRIHRRVAVAHCGINDKLLRNLTNKAKSNPETELYLPRLIPIKF